MTKTTTRRPATSTSAPKVKHASRDFSVHVEGGLHECLCNACYPAYRRRWGSAPHVAAVLALKTALAALARVPVDDDDAGLDADAATFALNWSASMLDGELVQPAGWGRKVEEAVRKAKDGPAVEVAILSLFDAADSLCELQLVHECPDGRACDLCFDADGTVRLCLDWAGLLAQSMLATATIARRELLFNTRSKARLQRAELTGVEFRPQAESLQASAARCIKGQRDLLSTVEAVARQRT